MFDRRARRLIGCRAIGLPYANFNVTLLLSPASLSTYSRFIHSSSAFEALLFICMPGMVPPASSGLDTNGHGQISKIWKTWDFAGVLTPVPEEEGSRHY
jgi:hypothetical protein